MFRAIVLSVAIAIALPLQAQDGPAPTIEGTIQGQIDAFIASDVDRAFTYASPMIKRIFGSSQRFGVMVEQGYPMVWRPADVQFLELREIAGRQWQKVLITDQSGALHVLDYQMIEAENGWQINAVQILKVPQVGA